MTIPRLLLALALLLMAMRASAAPTNHQRWTLAAAESLPTYFEDRAPELEPAKAEQLASVARAVAAVSLEKAPRAPREWAALLLTIGYHESTFSLRIHRGECNLLKRECDAKRLKTGELVARARSSFQLHENDHTRPVWEKLWGVENTEVQVQAADGMLRRAYWQCSRSGVPWLPATINAFAGRRCGDSWGGLDVRVATWGRLVRVGVPTGGAS